MKLLLSDGLQGAALLGVALGWVRKEGGESRDRLPLSDVV